MILDKIYFWKISTEDDIEKINYVGRQLGWAGAFRPDPFCQEIQTLASKLWTLYCFMPWTVHI